MKMHRLPLFRCATVVALASLVVACNTVQGMRPQQQRSEEHAARVQRLQLDVLRFADEYAERVISATNTFQQREGISPQDRLGAQNWKLQQATAAYTIASGPDPLTNALDLIVIATLSRRVVEDFWVGDLYGDRAAGVLEAHRALEPQAWKLLTGMLTEQQMAQVRSTIDKWRAENPNVSSVAHVHFLDFAQAANIDTAREAKEPGNLFSVVGLDFFSTLDPAVREIAQTRQLAERTIYYLQRAPTLLDLQVELLTYRMAVMPEVKTLLNDAERISLVGSAADRLSTDLPGILAREREAIIKQLMGELDAHKATIGSLSGDVRSTLQAGTETVAKLHDALEAFDRIMARFPPAAPGSEPAAPGKPFDITEYAQTARDLTTALREVNALATRLDTSLPSVNNLAKTTTDRVQGIVDSLFWKLSVLIALTIVGVFVAALLYRLLMMRIQSSRA